MSGQENSSEIYLGLMSGTSLDGIDAVALDLSQTTPRIIFTHSHEIPPPLHQAILALCSPGNNEIDRMGELDQQLGTLFAEASLALIKKSDLNAQQIRAIGSHGQTIRHRPNQSIPFTLQIGNGAVISELTGITTVTDFRSRDIAAGGEGAPLVPAFHSHVFDTPDERRCIVNIGGIANITYLAGNSSEEVIGFDSGPGNLLLDYWCKSTLGKSFDENGQFGCSGEVNTYLLDSLLSDNYFSLSAPKSTGRELFNETWLHGHLTHAQNIAPQDVQATLAELTALSISKAVKDYAPDTKAVYVCGGGTHNCLVMERLARHLSPIIVNSSEKIGLHPDWVEACAFAWLAKQTINNLPGNLPAVTGAKHPAVLGAIYPA